MLVILFLNHVYFTSHLDRVLYPLVALCGMIVTLLDSSVYFCFFFVDGYICLFLTHGLINEYSTSVFILLVLQAYLHLG